MRKLKIFTSLVLLATTPTMLVYPQPTFQAHKVNYEEQKTEKNYLFSYDDMLHLLDAIEFGDLENKCTLQELEKVKHFVAFLAKEGTLSDNSEESLSLDEDIEDLLNGEDIYEDSLSFMNEFQYMIVPAVLYGDGEVVLCKSWLKKRWNHVKKFVKKHKKALIIGVVVVTAAAAVALAITAASAVAGAAAGAAGAAAAPDSQSDKKDQQENSVLPQIEATEAPILKAMIDNEISSFKKNMVEYDFFPPTNPAEQQELSWQERGRILGSVKASDIYDDLQRQLPFHPRLAQDIGHRQIDRQFSTDYSYLFPKRNQEIDFNTLPYQMLGEKALSQGYYNQALQDFEKVIKTNPSHPIAYLKRGMAHFGLGEYDHSLADYRQFTSKIQAQPSSLPLTDSSLGFAKGLSKGIYESGEGLLLFMVDFVKHPFQTSRQVIDSVSLLVDLVRQDEWGVIAEALSPEVHHLVTQWDVLPLGEREELAGYAIGKHGADIVLPGALAKVASKSAKSARKLAAVSKNLQIAQETLLLETAAGIGNGAKIAEVVEASQKTAFLGEELGLTAREAGQLKQAGMLEPTLAKRYDHLSLSMQESVALYKKAQDALKPYAKKPMPEMKVRELIHETGIPTFERPKGIPKDFLVMVADKGAGMEYVHPTNTHLSVRIMPGKPHSPNPYQQQPYVIQMKHGQALDKHGNMLNKKEPKAHIPLEEFIYRD